MEAKSVLEKYYNFFPGEVGKFKILDEQIINGEDLRSRKNFNGHVTASGLVICPSGQKALMVYHKGLEMYLQPGGHIEEVDVSLVETARREVIEETGLVDFELSEWCKVNSIPLLIDTHKIPANIKKNEDEHYHHDFMYLFEASCLDVIVQLEEVSEAKWIDFDDLEGLDDAVGKAVRRYLKSHNGKM